MTTELIKTTDINPAMVFVPNGLEPILKEIKKEVSTLVPDISTDKGRKEIASLCYKIKRSKTYLDGIGKDYVAELKQKPKIVDAERKRVRDYLDQLEEITRRPLTDWEEAEEARKNGILARINAIDPFEGGMRSLSIDDHSLDDFKTMLKVVTDFVIDDSLAEYKDTAIHRRDETILKLEGLIAKKQKYLDEQEELDRLRKEAAEKEQREREDQLKREAAEKARQEAAAKAAAEAAKLEEQRKAAEAKAKAEAEQAERDKQAAIEAQKAAERRAKEAEENAQREAEAAAQRERDRIAAEQKAEQEAAAKREANKKHNAKINNQAVKAIMLAMSEVDTSDAKNAEAVAKAIVVAIAKNQIPNVSITY